MARLAWRTGPRPPERHATLWRWRPPLPELRRLRDANVADRHNIARRPRGELGASASPGGRRTPPLPPTAPQRHVAPPRAWGAYNPVQVTSEAEPQLMRGRCSAAASPGAGRRGEGEPHFSPTRISRKSRKNLAIISRGEVELRTSSRRGTRASDTRERRLRRMSQRTPWHRGAPRWGVRAELVTGWPGAAPLNVPRVTVSGMASRRLGSPTHKGLSPPTP